DRLVMRDVVLLGAEDLVPGLQREPEVDQRQAGGGVLGEADLLGLSTEVRRGDLSDAALEVLRIGLEHSLLDGEEGVLVEGLAPGVDRVAHRGGVRGDVEAGEVEVPRVKAELAADALPVVQLRSGRGGGLEGGEEVSRGEQDAGIATGSVA